jgi:hypothetical protein
MRLAHFTRKALSGCCFFFASIWGAAAAFRWFFGVRITFPLFPPLDLERVSVVPAFLVALAFMILGAWLGRTSKDPANHWERV